MNDTIRATRVCMFCGGEARVLVPDGSDELDVDAAFSSGARFFSDVEDGDPIGVGCYRCSRKVRARLSLPHTTGTTRGYGLAPSNTPGELAPSSVLRCVLTTPTSSAQDRMAPQLLRPSEVAEILGVTTRTVRALAERGELVKVKLGRRSARYQLADVERFIARHVVTPEHSESAPQGAPAKGDDGAPRREG